jgi:sugar phosphate isomerase/epimerase
MGEALIGLQLYTMREAMAADFAGTLRQVAEIGFDGVETAFFGAEVEVPLAEASAQLKALGLHTFCAHVDLPIGDKRDAVLRHAEAFGCTRIVWHGWPEDARYSSLDGIRRLADEYNTANEFAAANGLKLGLHNHWWEMTPVQGELPYQLLLKWLDPRIFFELDTYWATVAGRDAVAVIREMEARAPLLHIKDGPTVRGQPMVAVGSGVMDIPAIVAASRETAEWLIVELDECATDMLKAVDESYKFLSA